MPISRCPMLPFAWLAAWWCLGVIGLALEIGKAGLRLSQEPRSVWAGLAEHDAQDAERRTHEIARKHARTHAA